MKLLIMSDLHLEMHADGGAEFIRSLDPSPLQHIGPSVPQPRPSERQRLSMPP